MSNTSKQMTEEKCEVKDPKKRKKSGKRRSSHVNRNNLQDRFAIREKEKGKFPNSSVSNTSNSPNWYFKDQNILKDVASFSFETALGRNLRLNTTLIDASDESDAFFTAGITSIPGVMSLQIALTAGTSDDAQSPVNLAAQNVYSFVRYKNSGASNYDAPDLMMYLLAMDSVFAAWNWMKRIYGEASTYSSTNTYLPKALLAAERVDLDDIYSNLADFRAYLNMAAGRISAFNVPSTMTYMVRHSWLFSNLYRDADTRKAQTYMYVPAYFFTYDETSSPSGGFLKPLNIQVGYQYSESSPASNGLLKFSDLKSLLNTLINNLQYSEDIGIMSGDILKAYGEGNLFKLSTFDADYRVEPVYSAEVLTQIENCQIIPATTADLATFSIKQDPNTNWIKTRYAFTSKPARGITGTFLNFHKEDISPEDVIVASRLTYTASLTGAPSDPTVLDGVGSELVIGGLIFYNTESSTWSDPASGGKQTLESYVVTNYITIDGSLSGAQFTQKLAYAMLMTAFDWCPQYTFVIVDNDSSDHTKYISVPWIKDYDRYTIIDLQDIRAMHELAVLTEFNVPN